MPKKDTRTVVEWITHVLGRKTMSASEIEVALLKIKDLEDRFRVSKNVRGYISSVLSSATDAEGQRLFHAVERGQYRALTGAQRVARKQAAVMADQAAVLWMLGLSEEDSKHLDRLQRLTPTKVEKIIDVLEAIDRA